MKIRVPTSKNLGLVQPTGVPGAGLQIFTRVNTLAKLAFILVCIPQLVATLCARKSQLTLPLPSGHFNDLSSIQHQTGAFQDGQP